MTNAEIEKLIRQVEADVDNGEEIRQLEAALAEALTEAAPPTPLSAFNTDGQFVSYAEMQESAGIRAGPMGLNRKGLNRIV